MACHVPLSVPIDAINIDYFVQWRQWAWTPAVRSLIATGEQFRGASILEIGPNEGKMSVLFALLGATVDSFELESKDLAPAQAEIERFGVGGRVRLTGYSGDPADLPDSKFDFIFTKSVLVSLGDALAPMLAGIASRLKPEGELIAVENLRGGIIHSQVRQRLHPNWTNDYGVDDEFRLTMETYFKQVEMTSFRHLVSAIRASN